MCGGSTFVALLHAAISIRTGAMLIFWSNSTAVIRAHSRSRRISVSKQHSRIYWAARWISSNRMRCAIPISRRALKARASHSLKRDPKSLLWDAREAAEVIAAITLGKSFADFDQDIVLRS